VSEHGTANLGIGRLKASGLWEETSQSVTNAARQSAGRVVGYGPWSPASKPLAPQYSKPDRRAVRRVHDVVSQTGHVVGPATRTGMLRISRPNAAAPAS